MAVMAFLQSREWSEFELGFGKRVDGAFVRMRA